MSASQNVSAAQIAALKQEFDDACMDAVEKGAKLEYSASYYLKMRAQYGSWEAARRLMNGRLTPYGVATLKSMKRLDHNIKAIVHDNPKFQALFDQKTLANCTGRLVAVGYI